jgi:hypothetical protein
MVKGASEACQIINDKLVRNKRDSDNALLDHTSNSLMQNNVEEMAQATQYAKWCA